VGNRGKTRGLSPKKCKIYPFLPHPLASLGGFAPEFWLLKYRYLGFAPEFWLLKYRYLGFAPEFWLLIS